MTAVKNIPKYNTAYFKWDVLAIRKLIKYEKGATIAQFVECRTLDRKVTKIISEHCCVNSKQNSQYIAWVMLS